MTTDTTTTTTRKFDRAAIEADLLAGLSSKEAAEVHGCSVAYAISIRRSLSPDGERLDQRGIRAATLRKRAQQLESDVGLVEKWSANDPGETTFALIATLQDIVARLQTAASMFEAVPEEALSAKRERGSSKTDFTPGDVVAVKEKRLADYEGITESPLELTVLTVRERDVLVQDRAGARLFFPKKDLTTTT